MFGHKCTQQSAQNSARGMRGWHNAGRRLGPHQCGTCQSPVQEWVLLLTLMKQKRVTLVTGRRKPHPNPTRAGPPSLLLKFFFKG